ncbi:hypothetical protein D1227_04895, partial [Henriciella mobilis]|uniref:hypothetical protein n=1 Tax=Henriciella mobilis TaxID=2305467 RepID=UPI000EC6A0C5
GHHQLAQDLRTKSIHPNIVQLLNELIDSHEHKPIIFSSEQFSNLIGPKFIGSLHGLIESGKARTSLETLIFFRRFDKFLDSMFLQSARYGRVRVNPDEYAIERLSSIYQLFKHIKLTNEKFDGVIKYTPYAQGENILNLFESSVPCAAGLSQISGLPRTEKFSLKQQIFIFYSATLFGEKMSVDQVNKMVTGMREDAVRLDNDHTQYSTISPKVAQICQHMALASAEKFGMDDYLSAFDRDTELNWQPFELDVLSQQDIKTMSHYAFESAQPSVR